ncbi:DUF4157 domain-containing protein (plasmid) [Acaryochloris sp. CCMEE 5410]|nr:DUF4157 domain-containing protein [Acaryochloris sp. CCMEE 5410]KAI9129572.1 DUF4157 domain-containing protein [Acaryochloris sp. CCMEE 5410]
MQPPQIQARSNEEGLAEHAERLKKFQRLGSSMIQMGPPRLDNDQTNSIQPKPWIQRKLTLGEPGDKYELEADRVASQVVQQINTPAFTQSNLRQLIQREKDLERKMQANCFKAVIQRQQAITGGEASPDLESAIHRAKGSGQPLDAGLQQSMGQAMGIDFSNVRVHTDAQSDQLNQSIQAKAFTTGQDVFFRSGAYQPGNRGGQELIAHELTHVVQQNRSLISSKAAESKQLQTDSSSEPAAGKEQLKFRRQLDNEKTDKTVSDLTTDQNQENRISVMNLGGVVLGVDKPIIQRQSEGENIREDYPLPKIEKEFFDFGEKHKIFVVKHGVNYELMIASTPQLLKDYIAKKLRDERNEEKKNQLNAINGKIEQYNQVSSGYKESLGKRLKKLMKSAVENMSNVGVGMDDNKFDYIPPPTKVTWGPTQDMGNHKVGTKMTANPLSINPGKLSGSEPSSNYGKHYVKGHLLNHHLHGKAKDENLTPMTYALNKAFESQVESYLKQAILSENRVFKFEVQVYGMDGGVPKGITFEAVELEPDNDDWRVKDDGGKVKGDLDQKGQGNVTDENGNKVEPDQSADSALLENFLENNPALESEELKNIRDEFKKIQREWTADFGKYLRDILNDIVQGLVRLYPDEKKVFPKSDITYGATKKFKNNDNQKFMGFSDEHGTWMEAKILSINPGESYGFEPETQRWGKYVQGHLLNHHLHGPAESRNLLPMTSSLNTDMEKKIESKAKKMVLEENQVVFYKVWTEDDQQIDEPIELGKTISNESEMNPSTPEQNLFTEYGEAKEQYEIAKQQLIEEDENETVEQKQERMKKKREFDEISNTVKEKEDTLYEDYEEQSEKYRKLESYSLPTKLKARLYKLKLKENVDGTRQEVINKRSNWKKDGPIINYTGVNSIAYKANKKKDENKWK